MATRRPKGEGSLQITPSGRYKMTISVGVDMQGKQKRKAVTAKTKKELMDKVAEIRLTAGIVGDKETKPVVFEEFVKQWMDMKEATVSYNTFKTHKTADRLLFSKLYPYRIDKITSDTVDEALTGIRLKDGSKPSIGYLILLKRSLGGVFNTAMEKGLINKSPLKGTARYSKRKLKVDLVIPDESEMKEILEKAKSFDKTNKNQEDLKYYPLFLLALSSGMRIGELLGLKKSRIHLDTGIIDIRKQLTVEGIEKPLKTVSSNRSIYVNKSILGIVLEAAGKNDYVFARNGKPAVMGNASSAISAFIKSSSLHEGFTMHSFRHYHATVLISKGINIKEVSKRLGHKSVQTTLDLYAHWLPEMDNAAANLFGDTYLI